MPSWFSAKNVVMRVCARPCRKNYLKAPFAKKMVHVSESNSCGHSHGMVSLIGILIYYECRNMLQGPRPSLATKSVGLLTMPCVLLWAEELPFNLSTASRKLASNLPKLHGSRRNRHSKAINQMSNQMSTQVSTVLETKHPEEPQTQRVHK